MAWGVSSPSISVVFPCIAQSLLINIDSLGYNKNNNIMYIPKFNYVCQLITVSVMQIENQWLQPRVGPALIIISIDRHKFCWSDSLINFKFCQ